MEYIHNIMKELRIDDIDGLSDKELDDKYSNQLHTFVENNELCKLLKNYNTVFEKGSVDNGSSSVANEVLIAGKSVSEILASL